MATTSMPVSVSPSRRTEFRWPRAERSKAGDPALNLSAVGGEVRAEGVEEIPLFGGPYQEVPDQATHGHVGDDCRRAKPTADRETLTKTSGDHRVAQVGIRAANYQ